MGDGRVKRMYLADADGHTAVQARWERHGVGAPVRYDVLGEDSGLRPDLLAITCPQRWAGAGVTTDATAPDAPGAELVACREHVMVPGDGALTLLAKVHRRQELTPAAFSAQYEETGRRIAADPGLAPHLAGYVQNHAAAGGAWDSLTELHFRDEAQLGAWVAACAASPWLAPREAQFIDVERMELVVAVRAGSRDAAAASAVGA